MINPTAADLEFAEKSLRLCRNLGFLMPKEERTKRFVEFVNSLSDETFMVYRDKILGKVNPSKDTAKQSKNTEENVKAIIAKLPRLELIKDELTERVKNARKSYGLEV